MGVSRTFGNDPGRAETAPIHAKIAQLDQDASVLRNRSQITPVTRARLDRLAQESAGLRASLPPPAQNHIKSAPDPQQTQFDMGHTLYLEKQAPALHHAQSALRALTVCALPIALERNILQLIIELSRHEAEMKSYTPSQGLPPSMQRLLARFSG